MFKLFLKSLVLLGLLFLGSWAIRSIIDLPYSWPTDAELARAMTLQEKPNQYNTIFVGSSKTFRGMKPHIFNRYVRNNSNLKVTSFNYGLGGATAGQIYGLCRNLIDYDLPNLKYIFYELRSIQTSTQQKKFVKNLHTKRSRLWLKDWRGLKFGINAYWGLKEEKYTFFRKVKFSFYFFVKYIENKLNIGVVKDMALRKQEMKDLDLSIVGNDGYIRIEDDADLIGIKSQHEAYVSDSTNIMNSNRKRSHEAFSPTNKVPGIFNNDAYADELNILIEMAKSKGIRIIFVPHPMLKGNDYKNIRPVFNKLPAKNKVNLVDSKKFPEIYKADQYWDETHTNDKGAMILTKTLAKKFIGIIEMERK